MACDNEGCQSSIFLSFKMSQVIIFYGPYLCYGVIEHRIQKVTGLLNALNDLGYEVEVAKTNEYNRLSIQMFGTEIFRCDIRNLMFNIPLEDDLVCQRAVKAVEEFRQRICNSNFSQNIESDPLSPETQDDQEQDNTEQNHLLPHKVTIIVENNTTFSSDDSKTKLLHSIE